MKALIIHQGRLLNGKIEQFKKENKFERIDKINMKLSERKVSEDGFNYDKFCHDTLKKEINSTYELIIVHLNLSDYDYGEMYGLRVVSHLRLTNDLKNTHCQIIVLSSDSFEEIIRINPLGSILLTPGIQLSSRFDFAFEKRINKISKSQYQIFLNKINFIKPENSDNRHSIANELSLYLWSKGIGLDLNSLDHEISTNLYYKWVSLTRRELQNTLFDVKIQLQISEKKQEGEINILLIDDEASKGWEKFYRHLFSLLESKNFKINFNNVNIVKGSSQDEVIEFCLNKIKGAIKTPNVILLDLRLVDSDFANSDSEKLTGIQIAKAIENYNQAIQLVFTTASNKVKSYISASKMGLGVDGYIVKSPFDDVEQSIYEIIDVINKAYVKSKFLISVQEKIEKIKRHLFSEEDLRKEHLKEFHIESQASLNLAFDILYKGSGDEQFVNLAYMEFFKILENYAKRQDILETSNIDCKVHFSVSNKSKTILKITLIKDLPVYEKNRLEWQNIETHNKAFNNSIIQIRELETVRNRLYLILWFRNRNFSKNDVWHNLNDHRNNISHGKTLDKSISTEERVKMLLDFMVFIFNCSNVKVS